MDGSAGDADYGVVGTTYSEFRRPDPRIQRRLERALGSARNVLNVGAGAGSYEPSDRQVTAVEPSASMRGQRPPTAAAAIDAVAEDLPFADASFDAAMAIFTVHQWTDLSAGLRELRRVTRGPIVILTCDPRLVRDFWLFEYCPGVLDAEARRYPPLPSLIHGLGRGRVEPVPIPFDCVDGFNEAYYGRPEALLNPAARLACSAWSFVTASDHERFERELGNDLQAGAWDRRWGDLRRSPTYDGSLVLVVSD